MEREKILYDNLIALLEDLAHGQGTSDYYDSLSTDLSKQSRFFDIAIDAIEIEISAINGCLASETFFIYNTLDNRIRDIQSEFPDFNIPRLIEIQFISIISQVISTIDTDLITNKNVSVNDFTLVCLDGVVNDIPISYYSYVNPALIDSIIFISLKNIGNIQVELNVSNNNVILLFTLLYFIGQSGVPLTGVNYALVKSTSSTKLQRIKSALYLHLVSARKVVHTPIKYIPSSSNLWQDNILIDKMYQQFDDTINILSEYNSIDDIIDKYLRLYQIIEDFMFKAPLVELELKSGGKIFSIRDFKRMYNSVSINEISALKKFLDYVMSQKYDSSTTFKSYLQKTFNSLTSALSATKVEGVFKLFDIDKEHKIIKHDIDKLYPILIYSVRNSIVHNKATEFHLTYSNITSDINSLLQNLLIPTMESIIYFLTINKSNLVSFNQAGLKIWEDA